MNTNSVKVELVKTGNNEVSLDEAKLLKQTSEIAELFLLLFLGFFILCAIAASLARGLSKQLERREITTQSAKIPCPNCYFFNNNAHLRCAVHPTTTMTEGASCCPDYTSRK
ncbi:hypothetical protein J5X98_11575 [Leptothermofonsia sichuanensis E412]|uniref:hypothetical protein n=1 Tax=Leptothermofonsia sichuanensis TaxID=2917832 RepID=UPI001CA67431|nr:hypothetical protein [Leptothermofonsia sichuanensis]QZZ22925.1 hypothetical protein J5X98_11575 [Leptothermofonsia sichuanensis E412]